MIGVIEHMISEKTCPKCGKKMTRIHEEKTFNGDLPEYYVCYECGYQE